ncbi:MAG: hypothetical protein JNK72_19620 [Myxococcales bacterium]|nr:hypothetical protein [Myxococcales bacterium]
MSHAAMSAAELRALGGLALSCAGAGETNLGMRAVAWYNSLLRLGINVPLVVAYDLGAALLGDVATFAPPRDAPSFQGVMPGEVQNLLTRYAAVLDEIAKTDIAEKLRKTRIDDAVLATLLTRALASVVDRWRSPVKFEPIPVNAELLTQAFLHMPSVWRSVDRRPEADFIAHLSNHRLHLLLGIEQIDLDTVELLGLMGDNTMPETELVDLLAVFNSPEANDVVNFSLDILPSVLDSRRGGGQQIFSVDGYSGVVAEGSLDSLVLTELAHDDELFEQRFLDNEMLYYAHEALDRPPPRSYQILVDASASMRGARSVFARGLAIALAKRMTLLGFEASVRFFDSRLYEPMRLRRGRSGLAGAGSLHVAGVLAFKGERGRNYARVFSQLSSELERSRDRTSVTVYFITHAECHAPIELIRRVRESAEVCGVFMLPSRGNLDLDYLSLLSTHEVVTDASLRDRGERAQRALSIVESATDTARRDSLPPRESRDRRVDAQR